MYLMVNCITMLAFCMIYLITRDLQFLLIACGYMVGTLILKAVGLPGG